MHFDYVKYEDKGDLQWEAMQFDFKRGSKYLRHRFYFRPEEFYDSYQKMTDVWTYQKTQIERILDIYLTREQKAEANRISYDTHLYDYFKNTRYITHAKDFKKVKVVLKTVRNRYDGSICLPMFGEFIRLDDKFSKEFEYTKFEQSILEKYKDLNERLEGKYKNRYSEEPI